MESLFWNMKNIQIYLLIWNWGSIKRVSQQYLRIFWNLIELQMVLFVIKRDPKIHIYTWSSSTSTFRNITWGVFLSIAAKIGAITRYGPHHEAWNLPPPDQIWLGSHVKMQAGSLIKNSTWIWNKYANKRYSFRFQKLTAEKCPNWTSLPERYHQWKKQKISTFCHREEISMALATKAAIPLFLLGISMWTTKGNRKFKEGKTCMHRV